MSGLKIGEFIGLVGLMALLTVACGGDEPATAAVAATTGPPPSEAPNNELPPTTVAPTEAPAAASAAPTTAATTAPTAEGSECAHVIDATIDGAGGDFTISATVRSADTGWDKYADLWQVRTVDGEVLGERVLAHPHETEQPFTRSLSGVAIPAEVSSVVIVARDSIAGYCGEEFVFEVPHS